MSKAEKTCERILQAAEKLFSEKGYEATSLREITQLAEVNLASVNYHFGSKKGLVQAVLERYQRVFMPALSAELKALEAQQNITTERILTCFIGPLTALEEVCARSEERRVGKECRS